MPIAIEGTATRRLTVLVESLSPARMKELAIQLADAMIAELETIPENWAGNIKRGLLHRTDPQETATGGWIVGIGSLDILHRDAAPGGTISAFLSWYRNVYKARQRIEKHRERETHRQARIAATARERRKLSLRKGYRSLRRLEGSADRIALEIDDLEIRRGDLISKRDFSLNELARLDARIASGRKRLGDVNRRIYEKTSELTALTEEYVH